MQSKLVYRLASALLLAGALFVASCSKKDSTPTPGGGDTTRPGGVEMGAPEKYTKKAIVEEFTGTWCGWCPRMPILLDKLHAKYPNLVISAFHASDTFDIGKDIRKVIEEKMGVQGYPTSILERTESIDWFDTDDKINYQQAEAIVGKAFSKPAVLGLALNTTVSGSNLNITVKVGMGQALTVAKAKVLIYVVEDGLVATQTNYYADDRVKGAYEKDPDLGPLTKLPAKIAGYEYHHVVRKVLTDAKGDEIPAAYKIKGAIYSKDYTVDISKYKAAKTQVIAVVYGQDDEGKLADTYNAQVVVAGQSQKFD